MAMEEMVLVKEFTALNNYCSGSNSALGFMTTTAGVFETCNINMYRGRAEFGLICGSCWETVVLVDSFSFF